MTKRITILIVIVVIWSGIGAAQIPGYPSGCAACGVASWIDIPAKAGGTVAASGFMVGGWGFECASGAAVDRVDVYYRGEDGFDHPAKPTQFTDYSLDRPDVWQRYHAICPQVTGTPGFQAYVTGIPPGDRLLIINVWRGAYVAPHTRRVTVTP